MRKKGLLYFSLALNVLFLIIIVTAAYVYRDKWMYRLIEMRGTAHIVFFGDSMTAQGKWIELLGRTDLQNSGIPSLTTHHLRQYLNTAVLDYRPEWCFVMAGINDINQGVCAGNIEDNYKSILTALKERGIKPIVQLTLYEVNDPESNAAVDTLNQFLVKHCAAQGIEYLDVNPLLSDSTGLRPEFALDETHLNAKGYEVWAGRVRKLLLEKGI